MKKQVIVAGLGALAVLVGCKSYDEYREARVDYAVKHFEQAQSKDVVKGRVVTLDEAVKLAVAGNLDMSVSKLEEKVAKEAKTAELLGMLPTLTLSDSDSLRDNKSASRSISKGEDGWVRQEFDTYSMSQDKEVNYVNVDMALSTLDFGLAYFNSSQAQDRELIRAQRTKRAEQNLVLETVRVYFKVASAQRAVRETASMLASCTNRYELIESLGKAGKISPFRAFDEMRKFTDMEKRLTNFTRSYESAKSELRSLMGLYPNTEIQVDDAVLDTEPAFEFPDIALMEQIAIMSRPELYEIDMQKHINVTECRKTILMMFPNVRMFVDFTSSSNDYLYNRNWCEVGFRAAYDLLRLPQNVARYRSYSAQVEAEELRSYAQAIAVMAQVRMAHANVVAARERLKVDARINDSYRENLKKAEGAQQVAGSLSNLELAHMRMATAETSIDRMVTLGNYYVSYFQLLNTLGVAALDEKTIADAYRALKEGDERVHAAEYKAEREAEQAAKEAAAEKAKEAEKARLAAEKKAKQEAEAKAEAEREAKEAEAKAAAKKAKEAEKARLAAEKKAKQEAEAKAAAERKAKYAEEKKAKEAEKARLAAEAKAKKEAEAKAEAEREAKAAAEKKAKKEAEAKAKAERDAKAAEEKAARMEARKADREKRKAAGQFVGFWEPLFD